MSLKREKDHQGKEFFEVGNLKFSNQGEAESKINELEIERDKKEKAEKLDLEKEVARFPKKNDKKDETKTKDRGL